jgi:hypothetical protein
MMATHSMIRQKRTTQADKMAIKAFMTRLSRVIQKRWRAPH